MATDNRHARNWSVWYCCSQDIQLHQKERIQRQGKVLIHRNVMHGCGAFSSLQVRHFLAYQEI